MSERVRQTAFIYAAESADLRDRVVEFDPGLTVTAIPVEELLGNPALLDPQLGHVVVSAPMGELKQVFRIAMERGLGVGILPLSSQKALAKYFRLPGSLDSQLELALQKEGQARDLIMLNGEPVLFKATIGRLPVLDVTDSMHRWAMFRHGFAVFACWSSVSARRVASR